MVDTGCMADVMAGEFTSDCRPYESHGERKSRKFSVFH